jgi:hypothetical protein
MRRVPRMAISNAVGQLIIGTSINVDGASLSDLPLYKKGGGGQSYPTTVRNEVMRAERMKRL